MEYGLDPKQFKYRIVRPVLEGLSLYSPAAESLVIGTCMHESHLSYLQQIKGPALGVAQMEPATWRDIYDNYLRYQPALEQVLAKFAIGKPDAQEMEGNLYYAVAMCRVHYRRVRQILPPNLPMPLATYWKNWYNTHLGAGTVAQAFQHFEKACSL